MFLISQVYAVPFLVKHDLKLFTAMNKSIKIFMGKPLYTFGLFIQITSITLLLSFTVIGFLLLYVGIIGIFVLTSVNNIQVEKKLTVER